MLELAKLPLSEKVKLLNHLKKVTIAEASQGCATYKPHKKQDMFHRLGHVKYRYARTGNRFGKSDMGAAEDVAFALGYRPWYPEGDPARYAGIPQRCTKGVILCTDWGKASEVFTNETSGTTQGKLFKWIPKDAFVSRSTQHGNINKIVVKSKWGGESVIFLDTIAAFKHNEQRAESAWYDWIHVDEPIPQKMWDGFARGLIDANGSAWFTCTPLREPWINRFFLPSNRFELKADQPNFFGQSKVVIVGASTDNPYLSAKGIEEFAAGLDDKTRAARIFGRPLDTTGLVHGDFAEERHLYWEPPHGWSDINTPPLDYTIRYHIDCHPVTPNAVLFCATAPTGQVFFYNEIFEACSARDIAEQVREKTKNYFVAAEWMDPSGFIETMRDKSCFADDLRDIGLNPEKASKDLKRGILLTNQALQAQNFLFFAENLTRTRYEFDNYVFEDPEKKPDQPKDRDDHMMEGLHRLVLGGLEYIDQEIFDAPVEKEHHLLSF